GGDRLLAAVRGPLSRRAATSARPGGGDAGGAARHSRAGARPRGHGDRRPAVPAAVGPEVHQRPRPRRRDRHRRRDGGGADLPARGAAAVRAGGVLAATAPPRTRRRRVRGARRARRLGPCRRGGATPPAPAVDPHRGAPGSGQPGRHPPAGLRRRAVRARAHRVLRPRRPGRARRALPRRRRLARAGDHRAGGPRGDGRAAARPGRHRRGHGRLRRLPQRLGRGHRRGDPSGRPARCAGARARRGRPAGAAPRAPDSAAAEETVRALRADLAADGPAALVGGVTATAIDTNDASVHDRALIIPIVLAVILVILMLLLRAILAPVLLIATTVLSFGTAMGISALLFDHVLGFPGADPAVPLFGFVFLVALGIDYNIFLMTRVRE